jgi:hypothetical protein
LARGMFKIAGIRASPRFDAVAEGQVVCCVILASHLTTHDYEVSIGNCASKITCVLFYELATFLNNKHVRRDHDEYVARV